MAKTKDTTRNLAEKQAGRLFKDALTRAPLIAPEDVAAIERNLTGAAPLAVARRVGLAIASQDGSWFKRLTEDREMAVLFAGQLEAVEDCAATMRDIANALEVGARRVRIVLCHYADMDDIYAQGAQQAVVSLSESEQAHTGANGSE